MLRSWEWEVSEVLQAVLSSGKQASPLAAPRGTTPLTLRTLDRAEDAATGYKPGLYACIACSLLSIILVVLVDFYFFVENRRADRGEKELESHEVRSWVSKVSSDAED